MTSDPQILTPPLIAFRDYLLEYNRRVNVVSRRIGAPEVDQLIRESLFLAGHVGAQKVVDAGSGNGLLGLTLALDDPAREVVLVDSRGKKADFLKSAVESLHVGNARVACGAIQEVLRREKHSGGVLVARGFPQLDLLVDLFYRHRFAELAVITSLEKVGLIPPLLEKVCSSVYNIPERQRIVVWKIETFHVKHREHHG